MKDTFKKLKCNFKAIFMLSRRTSLLICAILVGHQAGNFRMHKRFVNAGQAEKSRCLFSGG